MSADKVVMSQYRQIAIDIAENISNGKYARGDKLFGRSVLASHYKVSPETIRKAVYLLKDVGIVETEKGSGIEIVSKEKADEFIKRYNAVENLSGVKKEIELWAKTQAEQSADILKKIQYVINESERVNSVSPLNPFQIRIMPDCKVIGKTVNELQFWHITGGTIIAIRRGESLIVSPGPYATLMVDDFLFVVGNETVYTSIMQLLYD